MMYGMAGWLATSRAIWHVPSRVGPSCKDLQPAHLKRSSQRPGSAAKVCNVKKSGRRRCIAP
eukprot:301522-Chlamydomonas_euryale.AAC.10